MPADVLETDKAIKLLYSIQYTQQGSDVNKKCT